jgi:hypothetical protein
MRTLTNPSHYASFERPGIYRRRIRVRTACGIARADLEDDPHRYVVIVRHDGERVSATQGLAPRTPWTSCREATSMLDRLVGVRLSANPVAIYAFTDGREQCTHLFDLAGLAIAHAARGTSLRQYDIEVPCFNPRDRQTARLSRDGMPALEWTVQRTEIVAPAPFAGRNLRTLMPWVEQTFRDPDDYEAIVVLRRGLFVSGSRAHDLDTLATARATGHVSGACYVFQPGVAERAARVAHSTLDFTDAPERLLGDLDAPPRHLAVTDAGGPP